MEDLVDLASLVLFLLGRGAKFAWVIAYLMLIGGLLQAGCLSCWAGRVKPVLEKVP